MTNETFTNLCHRFNKKDGEMHLELLKGCMLAPSRDNRKNNFHTQKFICMINSKRFPEKPDLLSVWNSLPC